VDWSAPTKDIDAMLVCDLSTTDAERIMSCAKTKGRFAEAGSRRGRLATLLALCPGLLGFWASGPADAASAPMYFDESSIIGIGQTITALGVPIETSAGTFIYKDVTIELSADAKGNLSWATKEPIAGSSPPLATSNVRAGVYFMPDCSACGIQITGPTSIGNGGLGEWVITAATADAGSSPPNPAFFYTGPLAGSPLEARLKKAGLTSAQYVYGIVGTSNVNAYRWATNDLFGLRLVGNELVVAGFTDGNGDHNIPVTQIIYTFSH
jgi:hypothetical protein